MTVSNPYYEFTPVFTPGTQVRSDAVNAQYQAIQTAFDFMPGVSSAITTDTSVFAPESGTANALVVTMPDTRTVNQDGDGIRFFATNTNTGAATLNVDGIGAVALVDWDGTALTGGEIFTGRFYEVRYDGTLTKFVIAGSTDAAIKVAYAQLWATEIRDTLISVAAGGDGTTDYSALHWADGASEWATRAEDSLIPTEVGGDGAADYSALHWAAKALASAIADIRNTDINTATPPTTEAVTGGHEIWDADTTDQLMGLGFRASNELQLRNLMRAGIISLRTLTAAGAEEVGARTALLSAGGLEVNNTVTGGGFERALTHSDQYFSLETTSFTLVNGNNKMVVAAAPVVATAPATLTIGDRMTVHNSDTSSALVTVDPATHSITGAVGTITSADRLILAPGETVVLVARTTALMEAV